MITRIWADDPRFKTISLKPGLNLLLADRHEASTLQQTRNGAGKSSLVLLIHFLLGADASVDSIFRSPDLEAVRFSAELNFQGSSLVVSRTGTEPNAVEVQGLPGSTASTPEKLRNEEWKQLLGSTLLHIPATDRFGPTWRSCFSYFARRVNSGGFHSPFRQSAQQQKWDEQVNLSFLLGLDWRSAQAWQELRTREANLKQLRRLAKQGAVPTNTPAAIRTELAVVEREARQAQRALDTFNLVESNEDQQRQAAELGQAIANLSDENTSRREYLAELAEAISREVAPDLTDLERVYEEVGVTLPEAAIRRFDEVKRFHDSVLRNRAAYMEEELRRTSAALELADREIRALNAERAHVLRLLRSTGGYETLADMQANAGRLGGLVDMLKARLAEAEQMQGDQAELGLERQRLLTGLIATNRERGEWLRFVISTFEELSQALYKDRTGSLTIDADLNGIDFSVSIEGERSRGIQSMQIYCFDQMLMAVSVEQGLEPPILVHDSHLFDGVDERQVAQALAKGHESALAGGWPYLVTLNSDDVPASSEWPEGFDLAATTLDVRLTDETETGGLFGVRFS